MKALTIHLEYAGNETWNLWCPKMQRCYPVPEDRLASTIESIRLDFEKVPTIESIIKNIPIPAPGNELPACRILTSIHAGIYPGQIGAIVTELPDNSGYAVCVDQEYVKLFGGNNAVRRVTMFFSPNEIQKL